MSTTSTARILKRLPEEDARQLRDAIEQDPNLITQLQEQMQDPDYLSQIRTISDAMHPDVNSELMQAHYQKVLSQSGQAFGGEFNNEAGWRTASVILAARAYYSGSNVADDNATNVRTIAGGMHFPVLDRSIKMNNLGISLYQEVGNPQYGGPVGFTEWLKDMRANLSERAQNNQTAQNKYEYDRQEDRDEAAAEDAMELQANTNLPRPMPRPGQYHG